MFLRLSSGPDADCAFSSSMDLFFYSGLNIQEGAVRPD